MRSIRNRKTTKKSPKTEKARWVLIKTENRMQNHQNRIGFAKPYAPIKASPPPPQGKPRAFNCFLCPWGGEFELCLGVVEKIEPEVSGFK